MGNVWFVLKFFIKKKSIWNSTITIIIKLNYWIQKIMNMICIIILINYLIKIKNNIVNLHYIFI
jgi:hypothetical protein